MQRDMEKSSKFHVQKLFFENFVGLAWDHKIKKKTSIKESVDCKRTLDTQNFRIHMLSYFQNHLLGEI